jgi:hypothetical protein
MQKFGGCCPSFAGEAKICIDLLLFIYLFIFFNSFRQLFILGSGRINDYHIRGICCCF